MKTYKINIKGKGLEIAKKAKKANYFERIKGLMFSKKMIGFDALLIDRCNSVHTFFMKYSIDLVFLNNDFQVVKIIKDKRPWGMTLPYLKANSVLELYAGKVPGDLNIGDFLEFEECLN